MRVVFFIVVILAISFGCRPVKESLQSERFVEYKTEYKEVVRDTTVYIPADSSAIYAYIKCDSLNNVILSELKILQGSRSSASFEIMQTAGRAVITTTHICDSLEIYLQYKEIYELKQSTIVEKEHAKKTVEIKPKCNYVRYILIGVVIGVLISIIIYITIKSRL